MHERQLNVYARYYLINRNQLYKVVLQPKEQPTQSLIYWNGPIK